jgi:acyl carrier protein
MAEAENAEAQAASAPPNETAADTPANELIRLWRPIFPGKPISDDSSFIGLEGDSLSYVSALIEVENVLGRAPDDWHLLTIRELARFKSDAAPSFFSNIEGSIALRALGVSLVVSNHFDITHVNGATSILFLVSGFIFGTLQLKEVLAKDSAMPIWRLIRSILLPYYLFLVPIGYLMLPADVPIWPTLLLVADLLPHDSPLLAGSTYLWYVHCLIHILLALLLCYYASHWLGRGRKAVYDALAICSAVGLFGAILLPRLLYPDLQAARSPDNVLYFAPISHIANFTLAAAAAILRGRLKHIVTGVTALFPMAGMGFFGNSPAILIPFAGFFLFFHNSVRIPRRLVPLIYNIAGGSLFIYFFHFQIQILVMDVLGLSKYLAFFAALAGGVLAWRLWGLVQSRFAPRPAMAPTGELASRWQAIFPDKRVSEDSSFLDLEGDSLSYVSVLIELENVLGSAPENWHALTIRELSRLKTQAKPGLFREVEGSIALRALGITLVITNNFDITSVGGATSMLMLVSGFIFGRLQLKEVMARDSAEPVFRLIKSILLPYFFLYIPAVLLTGSENGSIWPLLLMVSDLLPHDTEVLRAVPHLWYIDCLFHILVIFALVFQTMRMLNRGQKAIFDTLVICSAVGVFGAIVLPRLVYTDLHEARSLYNVFNFLPTTHIATFTLAAAAAIVEKRIKHIIFLILALYSIPSIALFGKGPAVYIPIAALFLFYHNKFTVPRFAAPPIYYLAGASLFIYLFQFHFVWVIEDLLGLSKYVALFAALGGGVLTWRLWNLLLQYAPFRATENTSIAAAE